MRLTIYRIIFDLRDRSLGIIFPNPPEKQFLATFYTDPESPIAHGSNLLDYALMDWLFPQVSTSLPWNPFSNKLTIAAMGNLD